MIGSLSILVNKLLVVYLFGLNTFSLFLYIHQPKQKW